MDFKSRIFVESKSGKNSSLSAPDFTHYEPSDSKGVEQFFRIRLSVWDWFHQFRSPSPLGSVSHRFRWMLLHMDERFPTRRHIAESCWLHDVRTLTTRDFVTRLHERGSLALALAQFIRNRFMQNRFEQLLSAAFSRVPNIRG